MESTVYHKEKLATWWRLGIVTAYIFLVFLIIWIAYRALLIIAAFKSGEFSFIQAEIVGYAIICGIYFGTGYLLRGLNII